MTGAFVLVAVACGDSGSSPGTADAAMRVKVRTVTIEVPEVVHREIVEGLDGSFGYGAVTPIGGADVCVKLRRDAFKSFEPFEEIAPEDPICATSVEGEFVQLEGVPANSDLVLTIEKEGYVPRTQTARTDDRNLLIGSWTQGAVVTALLVDGEADPWLEGAAASAGTASTVVLEVPMSWHGPTLLPGAEQLEVPVGLLSVVPAKGARIAIEEPDGRVLMEVTTLGERPSFVELPGANPAASYGLRFSHPAARCEPLIFRQGWFPNALPTGSADLVEIPVLPGHAAGGSVIDCFCVPDAPDEIPTDLATCTFGGADAGTP